MPVRIISLKRSVIHKLTSNDSMRQISSIEDSKCFDCTELEDEFVRSRSGWPILIGATHTELSLSKRLLIVVLAVNRNDELMCLRSMRHSSCRPALRFPTGQMACDESIHEAVSKILMRQLGVQAERNEILGEVFLGQREQAIRCKIVVTTNSERVAVPYLSYASKLEIILLHRSTTTPATVMRQFCSELHSFAAAMTSLVPARPKRSSAEIST